MRSPANKIHYNIGEMVGECLYLGMAYSKNWVRYGNFKCKCGKQFVSAITKVKSLYTKSCGCISTNRIVALNRTHGMSYSVEFKIWTGIITRCTNPNVKNFHNWGGRGVIMCDRWLNSFEKFYADMGKRPSIAHSIDRFPDKDGNYEPGNCRWATLVEQALNKRNNFIVEYKGEKHPLKVLTDKYNVGYELVRKRLRDQGWSVEDAFEKPSRLNVLK